MDNISGVYLLDFGGQHGQHAGNPVFCSICQLGEIENKIPMDPNTS